MSLNEDIINFINENYKNVNINSIQKEIDTIINNLQDNTCYITYSPINNYTINGIDNNINIIDFTYLIPNLFRLCYINNTLKIPNICPTFIYNDITTNYAPILLDEKYIKSFLYFNFPSNINDYSSTNYNFLINILNFNKILEKKKRNTTYSSFTQYIILFNILYSDRSILYQLINFNNYLNKCANAVNGSEIINSFTIIWDFTTTCLCYSLNISDTYIEGNQYGNTNVSNSYGDLIYNVKNKFNNNNIITTSVPSSVIENLSKNNFFIVLKYALEVFQDILLKIQYYIQNIEYCEKDYMNKNNLPILLSMYKNYYNNQVYTNSKAIPKTSIINIVPQTISIQSYVQQFINVYNSSVTINNEQIFFYQKTVYLNGLNGVDAFVFYANFYSWETIPDLLIYKYFYINIGNPSAIEILNTNPYGGKSSSVQNYAQTASTSQSLRNYNNSPVNSYPDGGLYPQGGTSSSADDIGYVYSYTTKTDNQLKYLIYYTLQSYYKPPDGTKEIDGYGVSLEYYVNYNL
jgi:hypothetical protein